MASSEGSAIRILTSGGSIIGDLPTIDCIPREVENARAQQTAPVGESRRRANMVVFREERIDVDVGTSPGLKLFLRLRCGMQSQDFPNGHVMIEVGL
jgi:hypothetical protein